MVTYTIRPASCAALLTAECPDGTNLDLVFLATGKCPEAPEKSAIQWHDLPLAVKMSINLHFDKVFTLPAARRGAYIDGMQPWYVEVL